MIKRWITPGIIVAAAALFGLLLLAGTASGQPKRSPATAALANPASLPGIITGPAPWPTNTDKLAARLSAIGLPHFNPDSTPLHIHQHLDIIVDGHTVLVPGEVGISFAPNVISVVHTEDKTGIIHVESPSVRPYYLGQFFDVWGVRLTQSCLGGYCADNQNRLAVYINGRKITGNPRNIRLADHQEIAIVYGPVNATSVAVPKTYAFPADL